MIVFWKGEPIESLTREELVEALNEVARELVYVRGDREKWQRAADPLKYLMDGSGVTP